MTGQRAEDAADELRGLPNMRYALFNRTLYTGEIIEGTPLERGAGPEVYALDRALFDRLQDEAVAYMRIKSGKRKRHDAPL